MYKSIRKRDNRTVSFKPEKITSALAKAGTTTEEFNAKKAQELTDKVLEQAQNEIKAKIPTVEQIQDIVEEVLLKSKYKKTAKAYILYRQERSRVRNSKSRLMSTYKNHCPCYGQGR
jgi:ribonucleoside-triphosphate reductase